MDYSARWYRAGDEGDIVDLLVSCLEGWPKFDLSCSPLDHWRWKYQHSLNPYNLVVAESGDKIIGCLHAINTLIRAGDRDILGNQGSDLVVHPDFRGLGVYSRMNDLYENSVLSYSFSGNRIVTGKATRAGGMVFPKPISLLLRIKDVDKHLAVKEEKNAFLKKYGFNTLAYFNKKRYGRNIIVDPEIELSTVNNFGDEIGALWERVKDSLDFAVVRDTHYCNWRYGDARAGKFRVVKATKNGEIVGYTVLRVNRYDPDYHVGYVADMLTLLTEPAAQSMLFNEAVEFFDDEQINCVQFLAVKDSPLMKTSLRFDFVPAPHNFMMWFSSKNSFNTDFLAGSPGERLHVTLGDTDWI